MDSILKQLLLRKVMLYLNGVISKRDLESYFLSNLRRFITSDDPNLVNIADQIDAALVHLDEELIEVNEFRLVLSNTIPFFKENQVIQGSTPWDVNKFPPRSDNGSITNGVLDLAGISIWRTDNDLFSPLTPDADMLVLQSIR